MPAQQLESVPRRRSTDHCSTAIIVLGTFSVTPSCQTILGIGDFSISIRNPDIGSILCRLALLPRLGSPIRAIQVVLGTASRIIRYVFWKVGWVVHSVIKVRDTLAALPHAARSCLAEWFILERITKFDWMIALLVFDIPGHTVAHEGPTAVLVDCAFIWLPTLNALGCYITPRQPNQLTGVSSASFLRYRGPIWAGAVILRTASRIIWNIFRKYGHISNREVKVWDTLIVHPCATGL